MIKLLHIAMSFAMAMIVFMYSREFPQSKGIQPQGFHQYFLTLSKVFFFFFTKYLSNGFGWDLIPFFFFFPFANFIVGGGGI